MTPIYVTVLLAVFNGEDWLERSIKSVLNQAYTYFEFIIVNDGSTDNTSKILHHYAQIDSRIRIFEKYNSGLADSLNYGLERARGSWIARLDADDICRSDRLQKQLEAVYQDPDLVLVGSSFHIINDNDHIVNSYHHSHSHASLLYRLSHCLPFFPHSSTVLSIADLTAR